MKAASISPCPRCRSKLQYGKYHDIYVDLCCGCSGVLVQQKELLQLLNAVSRDLTEVMDMDVPIPPLLDKGAGIQCPVCCQRMENYGYMGSNVVKIDGCHLCGVIWLDTDELGVMSLFHARTEHNIRVVHKKRSAVRKEMERHFDAIMIANAIGHLLVTGFVLG